MSLLHYSQSLSVLFGESLPYLSREDTLLYFDSHTQVHIHLELIFCVR